MKSIVKILGVASLSALLASGCASHSHELKAAEVSDTGYKALSCNDLHAEAQSSITKVKELSGLIDKMADDDSAQMAIGMILFWPALFALEGGDGVEAAEYSRLKGEINAMEKVAIINNCEDAMTAVKNFRKDEQEARVAMAKKNADEGGYQH